MPSLPNPNSACDLNAVENQQKPGWDLLEIATVLSRRRRLIFVSTFAASIVSLIVSLILPATYTAASSILPPQQSANAGALLSQMASGGGLAALAGSSLGLKSQMDTYVSMFRSRTVEDAMISRFQLQKRYKARTLFDARRIFERKSTAVGGQKDGIIRVTVDGRTPQESSDLTNGYVEEFQKVASTIAVTEASQRRAFFDQQLEDAEDKLSHAEQNLKETELKTGFVQPDSQSRAMIESAAAIQGQIAAKEVELQSLSIFATENNPDVVMVQRQIAELKAQLARFTGNGSDASDLFVSKGKVPEAALDYVRMLREVKYRETIFQALAGQYQLAKLDEARQGTIFQVIDRALPPDKRSSPHRAFIVILVTGIVFLLSCFFFLLRAAWIEAKQDSRDGARIEALLKLWTASKA